MMKKTTINNTNKYMTIGRVENNIFYLKVNLLWTSSETMDAIVWGSAIAPYPASPHINSFSIGGIS
jgi:hypothetical protein